MGAVTLSRFYALHVLVLPLAIVVLLATGFEAGGRRLASRLADATGRGSGLLARLAQRLERDTRTQLSDCGDCASHLDTSAENARKRKRRPD